MHFEKIVTSKGVDLCRLGPNAMIGVQPISGYRLAKESVNWKLAVQAVQFSTLVLRLRFPAVFHCKVGGYLRFPIARLTENGQAAKSHLGVGEKGRDLQLEPIPTARLNGDER